MMLEIHIENRIARLVLNHESQGNSFGSNEGALLAKVLKDKTVSALILTGHGSRFFCTGGNLAEQAGTSRAAALSAQKKIRAALSALSEWPKPSVALVNGDCFGGGTELASCF